MFPETQQLTLFESKKRRIKGSRVYRVKKDIVVFKWKIIYNYAYNPFKISLIF